MKRLLTLTFQYYKTLLLYNIAFTTVAVALFVFDSHTFTPLSIFIDKVIGFAAAVGLYHYSAKDSYFYYRNAGYDMWRVCMSAFLLDIIVYLAFALAAAILNTCLA